VAYHSYAGWITDTTGDRRGDSWIVSTDSYARYRSGGVDRTNKTGVLATAPDIFCFSINGNSVPLG
jgi:hypothetical protein